MHLCAAGAFRGLKKGVRVPGTGVIGGLEVCSSGAGNQTKVLYKSSTCFEPLKHLHNPIVDFIVILTPLILILKIDFIKIMKNTITLFFFILLSGCLQQLESFHNFFS